MEETEMRACAICHEFYCAADSEAHNRGFRHVARLGLVKKCAVCGFAYCSGDEYMAHRGRCGKGEEARKMGIREVRIKGRAMLVRVDTARR